MQHKYYVKINISEDEFVSLNLFFACAVFLLFQ